MKEHETEDTRFPPLTTPDKTYADVGTEGREARREGRRERNVRDCFAY